MIDRRALLGWMSRHPALTCGILALLTIIVARTWRDAHPRDPKLEWGWVTNCPGSGPDRPVFRINDQLVMAIPKKNRPSAFRIDHEPPNCTGLSDLPSAPFLEFVTWGNWSAGYKREDVPGVDGMDAKDVRPDRLWVRIEPSRPSALSVAEQHKIVEMSATAMAQDFPESRDIAGLTCRIPRFGGSFYCSGTRNSIDTDIVRFSYRTFRGSPFVQVFADYPSPRFGGIHVYWRVVTSDIARWRDIDVTVWKSLDDWRLSGPPTTLSR